MSVDYRIGDVREVIRTIPDGSVSLVASSPPFIALRSYLPADHEHKHAEIGSEPDPATFLDTLLGLTAEWSKCSPRTAPGSPPNWTPRATATASPTPSTTCEPPQRSGKRRATPRGPQRDRRFFLRAQTGGRRLVLRTDCVGPGHRCRRSTGLGDCRWQDQSTSKRVQGGHEMTDFICPEAEFHGNPLRYCGVRGCGWMDAPTDTELIAAGRKAAAAVSNLADRLNERSCSLNQILYRLAVASGMAEVGAEKTGPIDTEALLQRVEALLAGDDG